MDKQETTKLEPLAPRWYCVSADGMATLCKDQEDAQANARHCDLAWPKGAPHRAVLLGDVAADTELLRAALHTLVWETGSEGLFAAKTAEVLKALRARLGA